MASSQRKWSPEPWSRHIHTVRDVCIHASDRDLGGILHTWWLAMMSTLTRVYVSSLHTRTSLRLRPDAGFTKWRIAALGPTQSMDPTKFSIYFGALIPSNFCEKMEEIRESPVLGTMRSPQLIEEVVISLLETFRLRLLRYHRSWFRGPQASWRQASRNQRHPTKFSIFSAL